jgi:acetylornithine/succinyldiaminopimelate/putrescine aminotransferase
VAAIILEPVQGEGGFYAAPADFMRGLRAICDEHGILLIADEVQTGYGRTGKLFAMEHYDVLPDLITMAKSLAGGMPLSAVNGRAEIMDAPAPAAWAAPMPATRWRGLGAGGAGRDGRRKAGGPWRAWATSCRNTSTNALGRAADRRSARRGRDGGRGVCRPGHRQAGCGLHQEGPATRPEHGLLLLTCGSYGNVIRFLFPLTIPDAVMDEALGILAKAIKLA